MAPFARVDSIRASQTVRANPVTGGRFGDSIQSPGHRGVEHKGVDIYNSKDRTVRAAVDSEIIRVEDARASEPSSSRGAAGPYWIDAYEVDKDHNRGVVTRYLHLDKLADNSDVKAGSFIKQGTILGTFWEKTFNGKPGHLHFEVRQSDNDGKYGPAVDPIMWLRGQSAYDSLRTARLVSMLKMEEPYSKVQTGEVLYAKSGHRLRVLEKPGYPWLVASIEDEGKPGGVVTRDIADAADWVLDQARQDVKYSARRDGLLGLNAWGYRIRPEEEKIEAAAKLPPAERYAAAWDIRKRIAGIRGESVAASQVRAAGAMLNSAGSTARQALGEAGSAFWDSIPTSVKVGGAAVAVAAVVSALRRK